MATKDRARDKVERARDFDVEGPSFWRLAGVVPTLASLDWRANANRLCEHVPAFAYTERDDWDLVGQDLNKATFDVLHRSPEVAVELEARLNKLLIHYRHRDGDLQPDVVAAIGDMVFLICDARTRPAGGRREPGKRWYARRPKPYSSRNVVPYEDRDS